MPESFLKLAAKERRVVLDSRAADLGRSSTILEKDVWVCWVLDCLFTMPGKRMMVFKGGTSLSKAYAAIDRFSEDLDITIDYRALSNVDPFAEDMSNSQIGRLSDNLKIAVKEHVHGAIAPHLRKVLKKSFSQAIPVDTEESGEKVWVRYPTALQDREGYVKEGILVEFGGRNISEPCEEREIRSYIASEGLDLVFPIARPSVLAPSRTFWEKATLVHVECNRTTDRDVSRLSRHWYDLAKLADHEIGGTALKQRDLLADVVRHKKVFFKSGYANYDACLSRGLRLVPVEPLRSRIKSDYAEMLAAQMFYGSPPTFEQILDRLSALEKEINQ